MQGRVFSEMQGEDVANSREGRTNNVGKSI